MKKLHIVALLILFFVGCNSVTQPSISNKVDRYTHVKIKNKDIKNQKFEEDSLRCEIYAHNIIRQQRTVYLNQGNDSTHGNINLTNVQTGQQYSGNYNTYTGNSFSNGMMRGAALGQIRRVAILRKKAWKYCMIRAGWRAKP